MATAAVELHWTQTPEGRERMRKIGKARWAPKPKPRRKSRKARRRIVKAHWSQTPRGKKIIRDSNKRRQRAAKPQHRGNANHGQPQPEVDDATFSYALGHVECWIQTFAASASVPQEALTARLGQVLSGKVRR